MPSDLLKERVQHAATAHVRVEVPNPNGTQSPLPVLRDSQKRCPRANASMIAAWTRDQVPREKKSEG